jgi:nitroreductase
MDTFEAISSRRSIRKYTGEPVGDDKILKILTAAMMAPSAGNEQPWQFLVLREKTTLRAISQAHPYADMVEHADVAILVCADMKLVKHKDYWSQDCAAATQNMLLAAHALGLGAVWVGVYPRERRLEEIRAIIHMPDQIIPFSLVPVGHPAEKKDAEHRFDESRIHRESWR